MESDPKRPVPGPVVVQQAEDGSFTIGRAGTPQAEPPNGPLKFVTTEQSAVREIVSADFDVAEMPNRLWHCLDGREIRGRLKHVDRDLVVIVAEAGDEKSLRRIELSGPDEQFVIDVSRAS